MIRSEFSRTHRSLVIGFVVASPVLFLKPVEAQEASSADEALPPIKVTASKTNDSSEGTGKYTTPTARTATRMNLTPRETPQSISVISRERLDDLGSTSIESALSMTTGVMLGRYDSQRTNFFARGFTINNFQIDGLPRGPNAPLQDTYLWDRIEVVRGATGLMGGTGDPSAAINMVRKRPTKESRGNAAFHVGRWNDHRAEIDVSTPLAKDGAVRSRFVLARQERDSYMDRYHEDKNVGMAILEADLARDTLLTVGADFQTIKPRGASWGALPYWTSTGGLANLPRNTSFAADWSSWRNEQHTFFSSVDHRFAQGWLVHVGYAKTKSMSNIKVGYASGKPNPADGTGMTVSTGLYGDSEYVNDNFDLYASGPFKLLGQMHKFIAGWNGGYQTYTSPGGTRVIPYSSIIPDYRTWTADLPEPSFIPDGSRSLGKTRLAGAYSAVQWNLGERTHVITGARISSYSTRTEAYNTAGAYTRTSGVLEVKNEVTPYVGLVQDITDHLSAYTSYTSLFKPQVYKDRNDQYLDPITGSAFEVGLKAAFFDEQLNASAAYFETKQKNMAELDTSVGSTFTLPDGSKPYKATLSGITARGIETEVSGELSSNWNVSAGYTYLQAKTATGERAVPLQPRHLLQLSTAYRLGGALQGLKVGGSVRAQSDIYSVSTAGKIPQPGYTLVDLMSSYAVTKNTSVQLNVTNVFDRKYYQNVGFYDAVYWGEPRSFHLALRTKF